MLKALLVVAGYLAVAMLFALILAKMGGGGSDEGYA